MESFDCKLGAAAVGVQTRVGGVQSEDQSSPPRSRVPSGTEAVKGGGGEIAAMKSSS